MKRTLELSLQIALITTLLCLALLSSWVPVADSEAPVNPKPENGTKPDSRAGTESPGTRTTHLSPVANDDGKMKEIQRTLSSLRDEVLKINDFLQNQAVKENAQQQNPSPFLLGILGWIVSGVLGGALATLLWRRSRKAVPDDGKSGKIEEPALPPIDSAKEAERVEPVQQGTEQHLQAIPEDSPDIDNRLSDLQNQIHDLSHHLSGLLENAESFRSDLDGTITAIETETRERQTQTVDRETLEAFRERLLLFDGVLGQIQGLLSSNRQEHLAKMQQEKITIPLQKANELYDFITTPIASDGSQSLAQRVIKVLMTSRQPSGDLSFADLHRQVNFRAIAKLAARYIDEEYQSNPKTEARIEPLLQQVFENVGIKDIRPNTGDWYNTKQHKYQSEESRSDIQSGKVSRTYFRGFIEEDEITAKAEVILVK
jgi:molecular chaperone GrpE (heat shock protein)